MKITTLLLLLFCMVSTRATADELDNYLEKMKTVVAKDGRCEFGVAAIPSANRNDQIWWPKRVVCLGHLVFNSGTMKETKGCTAFLLDVNTLRIAPLLAYGYNVASNMKCDSNGFNTLMNDTLTKSCDDGPCIVSTVKLAFVTTYFSIRNGDSQVIVHQSDSQRHLREWFSIEVELEKQEDAKRLATRLEKAKLQKEKQSAAAKAAAIKASTLKKKVKESNDKVTLESANAKKIAKEAVREKENQSSETLKQVCIDVCDVRFKEATVNEKQPCLNKCDREYMRR